MAVGAVKLAEGALNESLGKGLPDRPPWVPPVLSKMALPVWCMEIKEQLTEESLEKGGKRDWQLFAGAQGTKQSGERNAAQPG